MMTIVRPFVVLWGGLLLLLFMQITATSPQPASKPTPAPSTALTARPTIVPTYAPTQCPVGTYEIYMLSNTTGDDDSAADYSGEGGVFAGCELCPPHSISSETNSRTCQCTTGYIQYKDGRSLVCHRCPPGSFYYADEDGSQCEECPRGSFSSSFNSQTCELCPKDYYGDKTNSSECNLCPSGRITPSTGSTTSSFCISPAPNFAAATISFFLVVGIFLLYVAQGRFSLIAAARRDRIIAPMMLIVQQYSAILFPRAKPIVKLKWYPAFKVFAFFGVSVGGVIIFVAIAYVVFMYYVLLNSMIMWRGFDFGWVQEDFMSRVSLVTDKLAEVLHLPKVAMAVFYPIRSVFNALAALEINFGTLNVTCQGSQASVSLLVNVLIYGAVIIFIESEYQVFWSVTLNALHFAVLNKVLQSVNFRHVQNTLNRGGVAVLVVAVSICLNPFQIFLRWLMGFVQIQPFYANNGHHAISEECNGIKGAEDIDSVMAYMSSVFAWWSILPLIYVGSNVLVPGCHVLVKDLISNRIQQKSILLTAGRLSSSSSSSSKGQRLSAEEGIKAALPAAPRVHHVPINSKEDYPYIDLELLKLKEEPSLSCSLRVRHHAHAPYHHSESTIFWQTAKHRFLTLFSPDMLFALFAKTWINFLLTRSLETDEERKMLFDLPSADADAVIAVVPVVSNHHHHHQTSNNATCDTEGYNNNNNDNNNDGSGSGGVSEKDDDSHTKLKNQLEPSAVAPLRGLTHRLKFGGLYSSIFSLGSYDSADDSNNNNGDRNKTATSGSGSGSSSTRHALCCDQAIDKEKMVEEQQLDNSIKLETLNGSKSSAYGTVFTNTNNTTTTTTNTSDRLTTHSSLLDMLAKIEEYDDNDEGEGEDEEEGAIGLNRATTVALLSKDVAIGDYDGHHPVAEKVTNTSRYAARFPVYFELCRQEYDELQTKFSQFLRCHSNNVQVVNTCSENIGSGVAFACVYLFHLGHFFTVVGYEHWKIVIWKFFLFLSLCCGVWSNDNIALEAYGLLPLLRKYTSNRGYVVNESFAASRGYKRTSYLLSAVVGTRAILVMLIYNSAMISAYFVLTCGSPLFVYSDLLRGKLAPLWIHNAAELALEQEKDVFKWLHSADEKKNEKIDDDPSTYSIQQQSTVDNGANNNREEKERREFGRGFRAWRIRVRRLHIQIVESRAVNFLMNGYTFFLAAALLFSDHPSAYLISSLVIQGPYLTSYALLYVLNFAAFLQLDNADFDAVFGCCCCCCISGSSTDVEQNKGATSHENEHIGNYNTITEDDDDHDNVNVNVGQGDKYREAYVEQSESDAAAVSADAVIGEVVKKLSRWR